jgi:hypothetical protein
MCFLQPDTHHLANDVGVMAMHQAEGVAAIMKAQCVEILGPPDDLVDQFQAHRAVIIVDHVIRPQQQINRSLLLCEVMPGVNCRSDAAMQTTLSGARPA